MWLYSVFISNGSTCYCICLGIGVSAFYTPGAENFRDAMTYQVHVTTWLIWDVNSGNLISDPELPSAAVISSYVGASRHFSQERTFKTSVSYTTAVGLVS